jgi:hypothetical protein
VKLSGVFPRSFALALALAAGAAEPALADHRVTRAGPTLLVDGKPIRTAKGPIVSARVITFAHSARLLAVWDEYNGATRTTWSALSPDGVSFAAAEASGTTIRLRYAPFDPMAGPPNIPATLRAGAQNELYLVQFVSTPIDEMRREIVAAGGVVERFLPDNTHVVRMSAKARATVAALPYVRWVGAYEPAYRLSQEVRADVAAADGAAVRYSIETMRRGPAQQTALAEAIVAMGGAVEILTKDQYRMEAALTPEQVLTVAGRNEVNFIDPWGGPGGTDMNVIRQLVGATVDSVGDGIAGFTGDGVRGEVHDTECLTTHQAFQNHPVLIHGTNGNSGLHGTACFGINFAHWPAVGPGFDGVCTDAEQGIFFWYMQSTQFGGTGLSRLAYNTEATDPAGPYRSCYQTSSVGSNTTSNYTTISAEVDDYLFRVDYLSFQSQSNTGSTLSRPQAWAKNIVSVGATNWQGTLDRADDAWGGASYGPAQEGRIKPDLIGVYDNIPATWGSADNGTTTFSGTSGATPIVAGCGGIVQQMWHEGVWPGFGGGVSVFADRPCSTTVKALLCNTAYRYPLTQGGLTRAKQGWGMPDLTHLYSLRNRTFVVNADTPLQQGQSAVYHLTVAPGEPTLNATMCYIDPMGNTASTVSRINDLSLRVTAPDGVTVYWGNAGLNADNASASGGAADTVDTVENVFVPSPAAGTWTVEIIATQVVADAYPPSSPSGPTDAAFSLVVSGATPATAAACYANCDRSTTAPCLNVLDFTCFLNKFAAGDPTANCDQSTSPPVLNAVDFMCFLNAFAAGCSSC